MIPEYTPPGHLRDPYVRRLNVDRAVWSRAIRGRISKLADVAVARTLADYGNKDGTNCHPGVARLAEDLCSSDKTVMRSLGALWEAGWITFTERGARKLGKADTYRLTIPAPVAVELELWPNDSDAPQWMERPRGVPKRQVSTGRPRPLERGTSTGHRRPLELVSSGHSEVSKGQNDRFLGDTGVPPPGSAHQGIYHHSDRLDRPRSSARGGDATGHRFDLQADDLDEQIADHLDALGYLPDPTLIDNMLAAGQHPNAIVNTVRAQQL